MKAGQLEIREFSERPKGWVVLKPVQASMGLTVEVLGHGACIIDRAQFGQGCQPVSQCVGFH